MKSIYTVDFLRLWEQMNNQNFKLVEFDQFWNQSGANAFVLSPSRWIEKTGAIGLITKSGKNGGTFAHKDIAFEFASWISAEFKLYLIAIKKHIVPKLITKRQKDFVYPNEADVLNMALFGMTGFFLILSQKSVHFKGTNCKL